MSEPIEIRLCDNAGMVSDERVEPGSPGLAFDPDLTYRKLLTNLRAASGLPASDWPEIHCTGSAHLAGEVFRCTSPAHAPITSPPSAAVSPGLYGLVWVPLGESGR